MTARRGSLQFQLVRFARRPLADAQRCAVLKRRMRKGLLIAGHCVSVLALALVAATMASQVWRVAAANYRLYRQIAAVENQNSLLSARSAELDKEIQRLHYPEYLVPLIHEQLGLSKPREVLVRVQTRPAK
jgi:cell division protein FtsB